MINGSSVTARNEVYIVITEAIHSVPIVPSLPILNPRPTDTPISNNNIQSQETTTTKDPNINNVSEVNVSNCTIQIFLMHYIIKICLVRIYQGLAYCDFEIFFGYFSALFKVLL